MCAYSLMAVTSRLAQEGEELVTHRFCTGCIGLASASDLPADGNPESFWSRVQTFFDPLPKSLPAVCIPPGASLRLMDIPEKLQREFGIGPVEDVMFTQLTAAANTYRDAVRFSNNREILLQGLREGQRVRVLTLGQSDGIDHGPTTVLVPDERTIHEVWAY
jgi:hypothetical protein